MVVTVNHNNNCIIVSELLNGDLSFQFKSDCNFVNFRKFLTELFTLFGDLAEGIKLCEIDEAGMIYGEDW